MFSTYLEKQKIKVGNLFKCDDIQMISIGNFTIYLKSSLNFISVMEEVLINIKKNCAIKD
ncbi:unnamed protein product [Brassica oleracea]